MKDEKAGLGPSEIAGRYEIVATLGSGAFGTVHRAHDKLLGRAVAIKTIRTEWFSDPKRAREMQDRFRREAQVAAQLKHPNIITIHDIGDFEGSSYIAMELVEGMGLDRILREEGPLPAERVAKIGAQVADALGYAHSRNVVHRDIKPANVMLEAGDLVKVADFGIAKPLDAAEQLTATGALLGTPAYMSPEQARGEPLDGRSDLFSLGCVLYEMLTGRRAFDDESITAILIKIATQDPPSVASLNPSVPEPLTAIIQRTLAKKPEARYSSGKEMARDLAGLAAGAGAPPPSATGDATADARLAPTGDRVAQAADATAETSLAAVQRAPTVAPTSATAPSPRRSGVSPRLVFGVVVALLVGMLGIVGLGWFLLSGGNEPGRRESPQVALKEPSAAAPRQEARVAPRTRRSVGPERHRQALDGSADTRAANLDDLRDRIEDLSESFGVDVATAAEDEEGRIGLRQRGPKKGRAGIADMKIAEEEAVSALVLLSGAETLYKQTVGRYGTLDDLLAAAPSNRRMIEAQGMRVRGASIERGPYRYSVRLVGSGYEVRAEPMQDGLRTIVRNDAGDLRTE